MRGIFLPELPRYKTRSELFDARVLDAYQPLYERFEHELAGLDVAIDIVPRMRLNAGHTHWPDDVVAVGPVPLGRLVPAGVDHAGQPTRPRLIIFRRPVEQRAKSPFELQELLTLILTKLIAVYLNVSPETIDPQFTWE
ncbi:hypothetical protein CRES_1731 [Corynebacterium resistens DSM 45100]|uniref:Metallopeptidase family protein n=2 Tax=Corynebacterium resistens TaxID=258224 RepID=F8E1D1_CORRG|nr:hypothetical protein CRES_1731 [Corynebacterium resistens DSM 45100]